MEKKLRDIIGEPTFGDKMGPVLSEISDAILERMESFPGDLPCYDDCVIKDAMTIFCDVLLDRSFVYWSRLGLTREQMLENARKMGDELRLIALRYCDFDTLK